jgi:hypothetical protein
MRRLVASALWPPAVAAALALLTYFQFPGHTWLQEDSQLWVPILEHQRDAAVLRNDPVAEEPHTDYTVYDESALALRKVTGLGFHEVLAAQQIVARALGIWGLFLMAGAAGLTAGPAWLAAMAVSLGASIIGPQVLTFEYEPTPRAFAIPLVMCAIGLAAQRRLMAAALAGACAFLFHAPSALPFWGLFALVCSRGWGRRLACLLPLLAATVVLWLAAHGTHQSLFGRLTPLDEQLLRMRTSYVWISTWPVRVVWHYAIVAAILLAAWMRVRRALPARLSLFLIGLAVFGLVSMPLSWLLLEHWKWRLAPQLQPMRWLLFVSLGMQILTAVAGVRAACAAGARRSSGKGSGWRSYAEAGAWFLAAFLLPLQPVITEGFTWRQGAVLVGLAALATAAMALKLAPAAGLAAFFAVPMLGGVVPYPHPQTPELAALAQWARTATPTDAVFLFPDAGQSPEPGVFRSKALRAIYVDWKSGGQMNYLPDFRLDWWARWQQVVNRGFRTTDLARYEALGIRYVVIRPRPWLKRPAAFENARFAVYETYTGTPARQSR